MTRSEPECWFLDPYPVDSHRFFRDQWLHRSRYKWSVAELPPRAWRWRLRFGGAVLAEQIVAGGGRPDIVVCTSMCDASQVRARLNCPVVVYWHENQLTYRRDSPDLLGCALRHASTLLATRWHLINSRTHRAQFAAALERHMRGWDTDSRIAVVPERVRAAHVIPPPVPVPDTPGHVGDREPLLLWNHRWCPEKRPEWLLDVVRVLHRQPELSWRLAVVGSQNEATPAVFDAIRACAGPRLVAFGHQPRERYHALVREAAIVLSTSAEENFGISVAETIAHGALPVLPDLPVYREFWNGVAHFFDTPQAAGRILSRLLQTRAWADAAGREARRRCVAESCSADQQATSLDEIVAAALDAEGATVQILF